MSKDVPITTDQSKPFADNVANVRILHEPPFSGPREK
jgi:hypothetical protein